MHRVVVAVCKVVVLASSSSSMHSTKYSSWRTVGILIYTSYSSISSPALQFWPSWRSTVRARRAQSDIKLSECEPIEILGFKIGFAVK